MTTTNTFFFTCTLGEINDLKASVPFDIVATKNLDSGLSEFKVICTPEAADAISKTLYGEPLMDD